MVTGARWSGGTLTLPNNSITSDMIDGLTPVDTDKLEHIHYPMTNFDLPIGSVPVAREEIVWVQSVAGTLRGFHCLLDDTGTSTNVDFDIKINGVTAMSGGAVNVTHADSDRQVKDGALTTPALAVDDVVSISIAVTSSTGAKGPFAWCVIDQAAAAS